MTPQELEEQVKKNTAAIKSVSDSLTQYVKDPYLDITNRQVRSNSSDIEGLRTSLNSIQSQINLQNRIEYMKDSNIVDATKLDLLQYDGDRWSNIQASKVVTGLLGKLVDLQDVQITNLRNEHALAWDSELQKWVNKSLNTDIYEDHFLSKIKPDSTPYEIWFKDSAIFGNQGFASGLTGFGAKIDKYGHAEFDSISIRKFLEVPELRYNRVEIQLGDKWNAPGAGIIESVEQITSTTGVITLKLEDGEIGAVDLGDLCMGIFHSDNDLDNAVSDSDDSKGNRQFAGFCTVYFEVTNILDLNRKRIGYTLRPVDDSWTKQYHPQPSMNFVAYGNKTNVDRQTSCYSTRTYTRYLVNQNDWEQKGSNIAMQFGDLSNLNTFGLSMEGYSAYLNSVYFTGTITQVKPSGEEVKYANDRGVWEPNTHYDYYDRVSVEGSIWLCTNINGTTSKPSDTNPDWLLQVSMGADGKTYYLHIKYSNDGGATFTGNNGEDSGEYMGVLTDLNPQSSNNPADYQWSKIKGETGGKGDPGAPGSDGLIVRRSEWKPNVIYCNESEVSSTVQSLRYLDIAMVKDYATATGYRVYKCIYTIDGGQGKGKHLSSSDNAPGTTGGASYWEELAQNVSSIYTDLIVAKDAKLDFISGNSLRVGYTSDNNFNVVAGITGEGGTNGESVRIWAGASEESRADAPFRVTQEGKLYANNAVISGTINATEGILGTLHLTGYLDGSDDNDYGMKLFSEYIMFKEQYREMFLGTISSLGYNYMGRIKTQVPSNVYDYNDALIFDVTGSSIRNMAIGGSGDIAMNGSVVGYSFEKAVFTSTTNTIQRQKYSRTMLIQNPTGSKMIGLPSYQDVKAGLAISAMSWMVPMRFIQDVNTNSEVRIYGRQSNGSKNYPQMYNSNGVAIEYYTVNLGDAIEFLLFYDGSINIDPNYEHYKAIILNLEN